MHSDAQTTLDYRAEREAIERQIAKLQYRLFELDRRLDLAHATSLPWPPRRTYEVACTWSARREPMHLVMSGSCVAPDRREMRLSYSISEQELFTNLDRIALFEHLHLRILGQISHLIDQDGWLAEPDK